MQRNNSEDISGRMLSFEMAGRRTEGKRGFTDILKEEVK